MKPLANKSGFTLIEVLVALVILAVALIAVLRVFQVDIAQASALETRLKAHWVAMDVMGRLQTGLPTTSRRVVRFNTTWRWRAGVDGARTLNADRHFQRIYVDVFLREKRYAHVVGFVGGLSAERMLHVH